MKVSTLLLLLLAPATHGSQVSNSKFAKPSTKKDLHNTFDVAISKVKDELENKYDDAITTLKEADSNSDMSAVAAPSQRALIRVGCLLAANSGFLNGMGLSGLLAGRKQAIAAVTGAYTTSALAAGVSDGGAAAIQLGIIVSYLFGSLLNGYLNPNGIEWSKKPTALMIAATLVLVGALDYVATERFFVLLAVAMGLQNSWTSMLISGNILRTCHFSGCTSDMGTFLGQLLRGNVENVWKLKIFAKLAASFWTGGLLSVLAMKHWAEFGFLVSVVLYISVWSFMSYRKPTATAIKDEKMM
mmetsp:Transcript_10093/g.16753  ORF Transcript_10093/g.16753 Transcript_10093/m.16753 type:complete len:300 (-) Transcript_10093:65-964(-)